MTALPQTVDNSAGVAPAQKKFPSKLFVELTTFCNLHCRACIKQSDHGNIVDAHMREETFQALEPALGNLGALILSGIGESLLHPKLNEYIRRAKQAMPSGSWIGFQSNGLLITEEKAIQLVEAGLDKICLSVDSVTPDTFSKVRQGGRVCDMERAFSHLRSACEQVPGSSLDVGVEFVLMQENVEDLPSTLEWAAQQGARFALVSHIMPYDLSQVAQRVYDISTAEAVALFERWKQKAVEQGVDLNDHFKLRNVFPKAGAKSLRALIQGMNEDARQKGIFLDVQKLLRRKSDDQRRVERVFALAREVAASYGMELKLPEVVPTQERRCNFVEDGAAMISCDGHVHPCYYLWHGCRCYIDDWEKDVRPKSFGSVQQRSLLDIWNSEEFRTFRENAISYDYPVCANCSAGPCDYVLEPEFEQDCYLQEEPCGACLWNMGMLQCLQ